MYHDNILFVGTSGYPGSDSYVYGGLYISTDNGSNWQYKLTWMDSLGHAYSIFIVDNKIFVGGQDFVNLSTDNGNSWSPENNGIPDSIHSTVYSMMTNGYYLYAATYSGKPNTWPGAGVFRIKMSDFATVEESQKSENAQFSLSPNPASDYITISFNKGACSLAENKSISIYNSMGIEMKSTKVSDTFQVSEASTSSINISTEDFPPGVFFLRVGDKVVKFVVFR